MNGDFCVNKDEFYEICDKIGILVWQEFPFVGDERPENASYQDTLKRESESILERLNSHPSVIMWSAGSRLPKSPSASDTAKDAPLHETRHNLEEVFKNFKRHFSTDIAAQNDMVAPFIDPEKMFGAVEGPYLNLLGDGEKTEALTYVENSSSNAFAGFGCPSPAPFDYISGYISEDETQALRDFPAEFDRLHANENASMPDDRSDDSIMSSWRLHGLIDAYQTRDTWFNVNGIYSYYYKTGSVEECCSLGQMLQGVCCKAMFEAIRRKRSPMAMFWCFNEPYPHFANSSIISYPNVLHLSYFDIRMALRDKMLSLKFGKLRLKAGTEAAVEIWALNDLRDALEGTSYKIFIDIEDILDEPYEIFSSEFGKIEGFTSKKIGECCFTVPGAEYAQNSAFAPKTFTLMVKCENSDLSNSYTMFIEY